MKTGIELIAQERREQIEKHRRTVDQDFKYNRDYQLSLAAAMLTAPDPSVWATPTPKNWDEKIWRKMIAKPYEERLIVAGALCAAEYDRLALIKKKI